MTAAGLIVAAGRGERLGSAGPKCFVSLGGEPLFLHSVRAFAACPRISALALVVPPGKEAEALARCSAAALPSRLLVVPGGATRPESVRAGLDALAAVVPELVAVHDGARPFVTPELIAATLEAAAETGAALAAAPVTDTLKAVGPGMTVQRTVERAGLWRAQTPQTFRYELIVAAHRRAAETGMESTDDAGLLEAAGHEVRVVPTEGNLKITTADDLRRAETMLGTEYRIGHGWDLHRLTAGRPLILGGVRVPHDQGLLGHSDGDAVCHALADALLGAAALGDIGRLFPDTDPAYAGADSAELLEEVVGRVRAAGWTPVNCDVTVQAQAPRLAPHVEAMRARLAQALGVAPDRVSVKGKTLEGLGSLGAGEAMAAHAVALLRRSGAA